MLFLIIGILGYFLSYKLTDYLAGFKVEKHNSRLDIFFMLVCVIFLFMPMSHITKEVKSVAENRELAKWIPFIDKGKVNYNFGRDYDNWFNDRYNFRKFYIDLYSWLRYYTSKYSCTNNGVLLNKQNHWFLILKFHKAAQKGFTVEQQKLYSENVKILKDYCKRHHKRLYFVVIPEKGMLYKDEIYEGLIKNSFKVHDPIPNIITNVQNTAGVKILYPFKELENAKKKNLIFYKNDHHLNDLGYMVVFNSLIKKMHEDGMNFPYLKETDFNVDESNLARSGARLSKGSGFCTLNIRDDDLLDEVYKRYAAKREHPMNKRVLVLGDSYVNMTRHFFLNMFDTVDTLFVRGLAPAVRKDYLKNNLDLLHASDVVVILFSAIQPEMFLDMDFSFLDNE